MPNATRNQLVKDHLFLLLKNEAFAEMQFRKLLFSAYNRAGQVYENSGIEGINAVLRNLPEEIYYTLVSIYKRVIPEYGKHTIASVKSRKTPEIETKASITGSIDNFFIDLSVSWITQEGLKRSKSINDTTIDDVNSIIQAGLESGLSIPEISKNIRTAATELTRNRAATIAITEVHAASMFASIESAKATGLKLMKEWAAVEDHRTRPTHAAADGQKVDMDQKFKVGGYLMDRPGDPTAPAKETIRCRCALLYLEKDYDFLDE